MSSEALMDTSEVAQYLKVHPRTIVSMVERGELKAYKVSRHWRYRKSDIDAYLEQRQNSPKTDETEKRGNANEQAEESK